MWGFQVSDSSIMIVFLFSHALWPAPQAETRSKRVPSAAGTPSSGWNKSVAKHSLALKKFVGVNQLRHVADRTLFLDVSGPLASQTDRRKTVACYIINTGIIKIWGVLDSVSLDVSPSWDCWGVWNAKSSAPRLAQRFENDLQTQTVCTHSKHWDSKLKLVFFFFCAGVVIVVSVFIVL